MNAYQRRREEVRQRRKLRHDADAMTLLIHRHKLMKAFELAHRQAIGYRPKIHYSNGWYSVKGHWIRAFREDELVKRTEELWAILHEQEIGGSNG